MDGKRGEGVPGSPGTPKPDFIAANMALQVYTYPHISCRYFVTCAPDLAATSQPKLGLFIILLKLT